MDKTQLDTRVHDTARLARLAVRRIMDTPREDTFDRLTRLAAKAVHAPVTLITLVDGRRQWFKSSYGLGEPWAARRETPLSHSFCQYVVAYGAPVVVSDARQEPLMRENLAIPDLGVSAYLGAPLRDTDGHVLGSFAAIDYQVRLWSGEEVELIGDFAELAMTEIVLQGEREQRRETDAMLHQAQKMDALGRLASGIAHDFLNLLSAVKGSAWILGEDMDANDPRRECVDDINTVVKNANQLVSQLLEFGSDKAPRREAVRIDALLRRVEPMLRRLLPSTIRLELELPDEPLVIEADASQLEVTLMNLTTNARDAMPDGGHLRFRAERTDVPEGQDPSLHQGAYACITVSDTGVGMDEATRQRVFEPFFTTKGPGKGSGLGLSMVYRTVQQLGGAVIVESEPGRGTTLRLFLRRSD